MQAFLQRVERSQPFLPVPAASRPGAQHSPLSGQIPSPVSTPGASLQDTQQEQLAQDCEDTVSTVSVSTQCTPVSHTRATHDASPAGPAGPEAHRQAQLTIELQAAKASLPAPVLVPKLLPLMLCFGVTLVVSGTHRHLQNSADPLTHNRQYTHTADNSLSKGKHHS